MIKYISIIILSLNLFGNDLYTEYVLDLIKEKNKTKEEIKKILLSNERTLTSDMLKGLYYQHKENNIEEAKKYYDEIILKIPNKLKNKIESLYISDYLISEKKYELITQIIEVDYCETLFNQKKEEKCYKILEEAKRNLGIERKREENGLKKIKKETVKEEIEEKKI